MRSEANLQKYLLQQARYHNVYGRKMTTPGRRGFPDVMLAYRGRVVFVEIKSPTGRGKLSELQALEIDRMERAGLKVQIVTSKKEADEVIREITTDIPRPKFNLPY